MTETPTPATRTLAAVLRDAMTSGQGLELIACADSAGNVAYVLAGPGRMLYLGTVTTTIDVVIEGQTITIPRLT